MSGIFCCFIAVTCIALDCRQIQQQKQTLREGYGYQVKHSELNEAQMEAPMARSDTNLDGSGVNEN